MRKEIKMKKKFTRIISITLAVALSIALSLPVYAAGTVTPCTGTDTVYMDSNKSGQWVWILLAYGSKPFTIKRTDVKVTAGSAGARFVSFEKYNDSVSYTDLQDNGKWTSESEGDYGYYVALKVSKAGTASVSYKIGSKSYKIKVKILAYQNPAKSVILTGVNGGKSIASLTKNSRTASKSMALKAKQTGAKLTVKPVSGWKIKSLMISDETDDIEKYVGNYGKGFSSAQISWGTLLVSHKYVISARFRNTSNGATLTCEYSIKK